MNHLTSLTAEYSDYRKQLLDTTGALLPVSGLRLMIKGKMAELMSSHTTEEIQNFVNHAARNGYFRIEVDAILSAANDRDDITVPTP